MGSDEFGTDGTTTGGVGGVRRGVRSHLGAGVGCLWIATRATRNGY